MISLKDYALDKLFINEGFLKSDKDYLHRGDYKYVKMLFSYLFMEPDNENLELRVYKLKTLPKQEKITPDNHIVLTHENFINPNEIKKLFTKSSEDELKSSSTIDFTKYTLNDIDNILRQSLKKDSLNENDYNILVNSKGKLFNRFDKFPFSGVKIPTRDQETATCVIFNSLITNANIKSIDDFKAAVKIWKEGSKNKEILTNIKTQLSVINPNFDNEWARSYIYQMDAISDIIADGINNGELKASDFKDLRMERYGGDNDFKNEWKISILYKDVINSYSKKLNYQKDSLDPTDVILYNSRQYKLIESILRTAGSKVSSIKVDSENHNADNSSFKNTFMLLYNVFDKNDAKDIDIAVPSEKIFFKGISLKKVTSTYKIEQFNINEETEFVFNSLNDINGKKYHEAGKTIYSFIIGKIINKEKNSHITVPANESNNNIVDNQTELSIGTEHKYKITLRTNGNKIACDIAQCKTGLKTAGPSLGKCPVVIWNEKYLKNYLDSGKFKQSPNSSDIVAYKNAYIKMLDTNNDEKLKNILSDMITYAIKCGPSCLPFIIIH